MRGSSSFAFHESRADPGEEGTSGSRRRLAGLAHVVFLASLVGVLFIPLLVRGDVPGLGDLCYMFYPGYIFMRDALLDGALPLWNPYMACGEPFLADIERGVFYPPNLIYLVMPVSAGVVVSAALHLLLGMTGVYALCRVWRVSGTGAVTAAVAYGWSSYLITKVAFPSELGSASWFPWVLAAFAWLVESASLRRVALAALAITMQFLAGYPETVVYTVFCLGLYALRAGWLTWRRGEGFVGAARPLLLLAASGLLSLLLVGAQVLPTLEAVSLSKRSQAVDPELDASSIHPLSVFTLLIPSLYGTDTIRGEGYWAPSCLHYSCGTYFLGVVPMMMLLLGAAFYGAGLRRGGQRSSSGGRAPAKPVVYLLVVVALFFLYSMGRYSPFFHLCWHVIAPLQHFTWPSKCLFAVTLGLACLAGMALDHAAAQAERAASSWSRLRLGVAGWLPVVLVGIAGAFVIACVVDGGLGEWVVRRFFHLGASGGGEERFVHWPRMALDSLKFVVVALLSMLLLRVYLFGARWRTAAGAGLVVLLSADLYISNAYLLQPRPGSLLEGESAYRDVLRPEGRVVRFLGMENTFHESVHDILATMTRRSTILSCPFENLDGEEGPDMWTLSRLKRDLLSVSWPMADRAFDLVSNSNFVAADVLRLTDRIIFPKMPEEVRRRLLSLMNCDRVVIPVRPRPLLAGESEEGPRVAVFGDAMPRAYVVRGLEILDTPEKVLLRLVHVPFDLWSEAKTDRASARGAGVVHSRRGGRVAHRVSDLAYGHNEVSMRVWSAEQGVLVISDTSYPGWRATIDGQQEELIKVNGAFQGLLIPPGSSEVVLRYWPESLSHGLVCSGLGMVAVIILLVVGRRRVHRS